MARQAGGSINKAKGRRIRVNEEANKRFQHRYNMTRGEWAQQKKEWRKDGEGFKIDLAYRKAFKMVNVMQVTKPQNNF
ncbi:hypothetical protein LCGC14_1932450 [marine sediment metagenome]|uniref:Uncharacterized protein n=1 Tax=marine sediment metagenome TaxID=412755 RepID=A0A0F9FN53_9ZZZZ